MTTFDPGPLADVDVVPDGDRWALVFTRDLRHPPERVWAALTDPARLREWAPYTADRDLGATGGATLTMLDGGAAAGLPGTVTAADPPRLLEHAWGTDVLRWELVPVRGGTRLTLRHTVDERPHTPRYAAGWHLCLTAAERYLDGDPLGPVVGERAHAFGWDALHDAYASRLAPRLG